MPAWTLQSGCQLDQVQQSSAEHQFAIVNNWPVWVIFLYSWRAQHNSPLAMSRNRFLATNNHALTYGDNPPYYLQHLGHNWMSL